MGDGTVVACEAPGCEAAPTVTTMEVRLCTRHFLRIAGRLSEADLSLMGADGIRRWLESAGDDLA